jgi:hypothetical protein
MAEDFQSTTIAVLQFNGRFVSPRAVITGKVVYKATQADGDTHMIVADPAVPNTLTTLAALTAGGYDFVVCEVSPEIPMALPQLHSTVMVRGITRWDYEHGWPELHPLLGWTLDLTGATGWVGPTPVA